MNLNGKTIGFGLTGSHCTYAEVVPQIKRLKEAGARVIPIVSYTVQTTDTKFGEAAEVLTSLKLKNIAERKSSLTALSKQNRWALQSC